MFTWLLEIYKTSVRPMIRKQDVSVTKIRGLTHGILPYRTSCTQWWAIITDITGPYSDGKLYSMLKSTLELYWFNFDQLEWNVVFVWTRWIVICESHVAMNMLPIVFYNKARRQCTRRCFPPMPWVCASKVFHSDFVVFDVCFGTVIFDPLWRFQIGNYFNAHSKQ